MRMLIGALGVITLLLPAFAQNGTQPSVAPDARAIGSQKMPARVPPKTQFAVFGSDGRLVRTLAAGEATPGFVDCVLIDCPSTFGKNVRCWKCK